MTLPIWFMRQAGRYLPEYQEIRKVAGGFLNLCFNPKLATEVTLQPIRRFDFDYAIIFSDILSIPYALGFDLTIDEHKGGPLVEIISIEKVGKLKNYRIEILKPVLEAISMTRNQLNKEKGLIGFCGAPWTLAVYMLQGKSNHGNEITHQTAYKNRKNFFYLIDLLTETVIDYLSQQIDAGCNTIQLFDSWANFLSPENLEDFVIRPAVKIIQTIKLKYPKVTIIGFPRGIGHEYKSYAQRTNVDYIGCDTSLSVETMRELQKICGVQGNLDNHLLLSGGEILEKRVRDLKTLHNTGKYIFNLGHGILPQTPIKNVENVIRWVREKIV